MEKSFLVHVSTVPDTERSEEVLDRLAQYGVYEECASSICVAMDVCYRACKKHRRVAQQQEIGHAEFEAEIMPYGRPERTDR